MFCLDKDECADDSHNCDAVATCTNTVASFTCACPANYNGDGVTCTGTFVKLNSFLAYCIQNRKYNSL